MAPNREFEFQLACDGLNNLLADYQYYTGDGDDDSSLSDDAFNHVVYNAWMLGDEVTACKKQFGQEFIDAVIDYCS